MIDERIIQGSPESWSFNMGTDKIAKRDIKTRGDETFNEIVFKSLADTKVLSSLRDNEREKTRKPSV